MVSRLPPGGPRRFPITIPIPLILDLEDLPMGNCASARSKEKQMCDNDGRSQIDKTSLLATREQELARTQEDLEASKIYGANTYTEVLTARSQMRGLELQFDRIRRQMQRQISETAVALKTKDDLLATQRQMADGKSAKMYAEHIALQQGHQEHILMLETALQRTQEESVAQRTDLERALKEREDTRARCIELEENINWLLAEKEHWVTFWSNRCDEADLKLLQLSMKYEASIPQHCADEPYSRLQGSEHNLFDTLQEVWRLEQLWYAAYSSMIMHEDPKKRMIEQGTYQCTTDQDHVRLTRMSMEWNKVNKDLSEVYGLRTALSAAKAKLTELRDWVKVVGVDEMLPTTPPSDLWHNHGILVASNSGFLGIEVGRWDARVMMRLENMGWNMCSAVSVQKQDVQPGAGKFQGVSIPIEDCYTLAKILPGLIRLAEAKATETNN